MPKLSGCAQIGSKEERHEIKRESGIQGDEAGTRAERGQGAQARRCPYSSKLLQRLLSFHITIRVHTCQE